MGALRSLWRGHRWALGGFVLASAVTLFFLMHIVVRTAFWLDPAHHDMAPQPWMTVGFIGKSWDLDPAEIDAGAGLPSPGKETGHPLTLAEIARQRGVPVAQVITEVEAVIRTMKAAGPGS
jgi:hypothetical protein